MYVSAHKKTNKKWKQLNQGGKLAGLKTLKLLTLKCSVPVYHHYTGVLSKSGSLTISFAHVKMFRLSAQFGFLFVPDTRPLPSERRHLQNVADLVSPFLKSLDAWIENKSSASALHYSRPRMQLFVVPLLPKTSRSRKIENSTLQLTTNIMRFQRVIHKTQKQHNLTKSYQLRRSGVSVLSYWKSSFTPVFWLNYCITSISYPFSLGSKTCKLPFAWLHIGPGL